MDVQMLHQAGVFVFKEQECQRILFGESSSLKNGVDGYLDLNPVLRDQAIE